MSLWPDAIAGYVQYLQAGGSPRSTVRTRREQLQLMARQLGEASPWAVTDRLLMAYFAGLDLARETRRSRRTTLRGFYRWAVDEGHVERNVALRVPAIKAAEPTPHPTPDLVYETALKDCRRADVALMLQLAHDCGMRRAEVATGHSSRLVKGRDENGNTVWSLTVLGKGDKRRTLPLPDDLARALLALPDGWFFPGADAGHLSPRWVGRLVADAMPGAWTMHSLRHSAATRWHEIDHDLPSVQELLGHASIATTRVYVATSAEKLRRLVVTAAA